MLWKRGPCAVHPLWEYFGVRETEDQGEKYEESFCKSDENDEKWG